MKTFDEILKYSLENGNVGERLLAQGKSIVYCLSDSSDQNIIEYPDGRKCFITNDENGNIVEGEPYNG